MRVHSVGTLIDQCAFNLLLVSFGLFVSEVRILEEFYYYYCYIIYRAKIFCDALSDSSECC